jgi:hypothetical protein
MHFFSTSGVADPRAPPRTLPSLANNSDWEKQLETSLRNCIAANNPVLLLFTKRLYKILLRCLLGQPFINRLPSYSLQAPGLQSNMGLLLGQTMKLFKIHLIVNRDIYGLILSSDMFQQTLLSSLSP